MFKKIRNFFWYPYVAVLRGRIKKNKIKIEKLNIEKNRPFIEAYSSDEYIDPSPTDHAKRKIYCSQVALFSELIGKEKILAKVGEARCLLEKFNSKPEDDIKIKGLIAGLWGVYDWFEEMEAEHASYSPQNNMGFQSLSEAEEEDINDKLNK